MDEILKNAFEIAATIFNAGGDFFSRIEGWRFAITIVFPTVIRWIRERVRR